MSVRFARMESPLDSRAAAQPDTLWHAVTPAAADSASLQQRLDADVAVIGAGYLGLSCALSLAEAGASVVVLEAAAAGWGASGRNNGLLAPGLKRDPDEVRRLLGVAAGERLLRLASAAPQAVATLIARHAIACDLLQTGWIQVAHSRRAAERLRRRREQWAAYGVDIESIREGALPARLGTDYYRHANCDPRGGSLNPLAFARGLKAAALRAGASVFEASPVIDIERRQKDWQLRTAAGRVRAGYVVAATNAYNAGLQALHGCVLPVRTAQIASVPLPESQLRALLPARESVSDTQRLLTSFRITADGRLIMGGASATAGDSDARLLKRLRHAARARFPQLGDIDWQFGWSGLWALTANHLPQILTPGAGFYAGIGCNGRGIAMATVTGQAIARLITDGQDAGCALPIASPRRMMGFGLRRPAMAFGVFANRCIDHLQRRFF